MLFTSSQIRILTYQITVWFLANVAYTTSKQYIGRKYLTGYPYCLKQHIFTLQLSCLNMLNTTALYTESKSYKERKHHSVVQNVVTLDFHITQRNITLL